VGQRFVYIKSNEEVWPCSFVEVSAGTVRKTDVKTIYEESDIFINLKTGRRHERGPAEIVNTAKPAVAAENGPGHIQAIISPKIQDVLSISIQL
jgi:MoaA/NifB/PqqE/SkfB family radical SAM enzyme